MHVAGVGTTVVVADDVAVAIDTGGVDVAGVAGVHHGAVGRVDVTAEVEVQVDVADALLNVLPGPRAADVVVAGEVGVRLGGEHPLRRKGQAVVVGDRVLQRLDRIAAIDGAGGDDRRRSLRQLSLRDRGPHRLRSRLRRIGHEGPDVVGVGAWASQAQQPVEEKGDGVRHRSAFRVGCFVVVVTGASGDLVNTLWTRQPR